MFVRSQMSLLTFYMEKRQTFCTGSSLRSACCVRAQSSKHLPNTHRDYNNLLLADSQTAPLAICVFNPQVRVSLALWGVVAGLIVDFIIMKN